MDQEKELFDSEFLHKLEYLKLVARRIHRGQMRGEHTTVKRGTSLEFSDHRNYQSGDDFRYIDWNVFSRLDRLFVKIFTAEEDLTIHILLDNSFSMNVGIPPKIDYAKRVGAALGYVGIANLDRVGVTSFGEGLRDSLPPHRSRNHLFSIFNYFKRAEPRGRTDLNRSLRDYALRSKRPGLAIVISDLLDEGGFEEGLKALAYGRFDVVLIQLIDESEIEPQESGALKLVDVETGSAKRVTVDKELLEAYRRKVGEYFLRIEKFCLDHHIEYLRASTLIPFEDLILKYLRQGMYLH
jgi:uncharacterized protein (DUF58 family)